MQLISLADVERISEGKATSSLRQPLLMARFSDDKSELLSFIQNLSRRTFDATFSLAKPDLDAITDCLSLDLVDFEQPSGGGSDRASSPSLLTEII